MKRILIIAGDKSGDLYGGLLSKHLKEKFPSLEIFSFGGKNLSANSCQLIDLLSHSVSGLIEVLSSLPKILKIFKQAIKKIEEIKPDLIIPIDFPDFNLRLVETLNKKYPIFYYVSPQVWAWRKKRIELIKRYINKMIVIFKFEEDFYKKEGIDVLYFGHPLLEIIKKEEIEPKPIISFLPGSRANEVRKHLPVMLGTKEILSKELPDYSFQIIRPKNLKNSLYEKFSPNIPIIPHSYPALQESEFIITSSGTATVEIAILGIPYLVIYKVNPLTWFIVKKLVASEYAAMTNILAGKKIVEELLQGQATSQNISQKTLFYLKNKHEYDSLKSRLAQIKEKLYPDHASRNFASFIGKHLKLSA
jgi:lipid-A-disaccharide synthase